eukprot:g11279.t1
MSDTDSSPKRRDRTYRFDPKAPQAINKLKRHIAAKAKKSITSKNNLGKVVASKAAGKYVSTYPHAVSGKFTIDLTDVLDEIKASIEEALKARCTVNIPGIAATDTNPGTPDMSNTVLIQESAFIWTNPIGNTQKPTLKLKSVVIAESEEVKPIDQLTRKLQTKTDDTQNMSVKFRCGVNQGSTAPYTFKNAAMKTDKISTTCATSSVLDDADNVLEAMINECLSSEQEEKLAEHIEKCEEDDIDTSQGGQLALEWLQSTYGVANMEFIQLVQKYMEFLSTTKTGDQNLYDFAKGLKGKLNALHDSKWSMTDLYNVLILAHAMKSADVDEQGNKVDYSSISKRIENALNKGERLDPREIVDKLETEAKTAKSALKLVLNGTAAEALQSNMSTNMNVKFDRVPPKGFGFPSQPSKDCLWCAFCAKSNKHNRMGWNGWNMHSVTSCKAHVRKACPFEKRSKRKQKGEKANKPVQSKSLEAKVAELTALVTQLSQKM